MWFCSFITHSSKLADCTNVTQPTIPFIIHLFFILSALYATWILMPDFWVKNKVIISDSSFSPAAGMKYWSGNSTKDSAGAVHVWIPSAHYVEMLNYYYYDNDNGITPNWYWEGNAKILEKNWSVHSDKEKGSHGGESTSCFRTLQHGGHTQRRQLVQKSSSLKDKVSPLHFLTFSDWPNSV